jgi:type IV secretory pathway VirJ component
MSRSFAASILIAVAAAAAADQFPVEFGRFGTVTVYRATSRPRHVVLFVSGDGGWNLGVVDMARALTSLDAAVVGIDITHYLMRLRESDDPCLYPAADLEALSQYAQRRLDLPAYVPPVLVGYSSGATLVYAALVQAPPATFAGAISLGFCPDLPVTRPFCRGHGLTWEPGPRGKGVSFCPAATLERPWVAFQGLIDQVCDPSGTEEFVEQTTDARIVTLPKVGHGFSVQRNWMPQFRQAFLSVVEPVGPSATSPTPPPAEEETAANGRALVDVSNLPLVEVKPTPPTLAGVMAVIVSGDGGWASIDKEIGGVLATRGIPVVGLNALQYFWRAKTPGMAGTDLARIMRHYQAAWHADRILLAGYSFGAEVLPFMISRLPEELRARVVGITLLAPGPKAEFEFHIGDWLGKTGAQALSVLPEIAKLRGLNLLCLWGEDDTDSVCPALPADLATSRRLGGGHHFGGDYARLAGMMLGAAGISTPPTAP